MIGVMCRHMTNDDLIQRAGQLITMIMHDKIKLEEEVIEDFIQKQVSSELLTSCLPYASCLLF